jgi:Glycosyltransferase sugar-binding region containing DXD motif
MKIDGDELPGQAFLRRLPELLRSRHVHQFWTANAWIYPDGDHYLAGQPWSTDFVNRLMRNDSLLRVRGIPHLHAEPLTPRDYLEEPFYHLDLLVTAESARRDKVVRYEAARPGLKAVGGGRMNEAFYLPELRDSLDLREVPAEDRGAIERALAPEESFADPSPGNGQSREPIPVVSLLEMDRSWEGRAVGKDAYLARIEKPTWDVSLMPAEQSSLLLRVSNDGSERWPASLDEHPQIRLSYRWLDAQGEIHLDEGPRTPFPRTVGPGESLLAPLSVHAPMHQGDYLLEVDIVHEHTRWFRCETRVPVRVGPPDGLPGTEPRLRESSPSARTRWRRLRIPRTIHRIWLGDEPMPAEHERFGESFLAHHRGWKMRLWTDADLAELEIDEPERRHARSPSELSNLVRYEILARFGGIYVDTDVECRRPLTTLLRGIDAFAALEAPGRVGTAVLGAVPGHPAFARAARLARQTLGAGPHSADANGPLFLSLILEQDGGVEIFGAHHFYPYDWNELARRGEHFPDAYAIHHWTLSWLEEKAG